VEALSKQAIFGKSAGGKLSALLRRNILSYISREEKKKDHCDSVHLNENERNLPNVTGRTCMLVASKHLKSKVTYF